MNPVQNNSWVMYHAAMQDGYLETLTGYLLGDLNLRRGLLKHIMNANRTNVAYTRISCWDHPSLVQLCLLLEGHRKRPGQLCLVLEGHRKRPLDRWKVANLMMNSN
jgi:hypothetical protein